MKRKIVEIVFNKTIDNVREVHQNYVTPQLYDCSDAKNNTNNDFLLSLTPGITTVAVVSLFWVSTKMNDKGNIKACRYMISMTTLSPVIQFKLQEQNKLQISKNYVNYIYI